MNKARVVLGCAMLVLLAGNSRLSAEPGPDRRLMSPLSFVQTLEGDVEMRSSDQTVVVTVRGADGDHLFRVDTDLLTGLPNLSSTAAEVRFWRGHLVVIAPREGKAWHFSVPGLDSLRNPDDPILPGKELDKQLKASYELTRIDTAVALISRGGPGALDGLRGIFDHTDTEYQDPTSGGTGGVGSCGRTCNITCGDGSSCSANCVPNRCASCSCPATCTCR